MQRIGLATRALKTVVGYKLRRALGARTQTLEHAAERIWTLAPGIDEPPFRPFLPDSHLRRILGGALGESVESILQDLATPRHRAAPVRAFLLRDVIHIDSAAFCGLYKQNLYCGPGLHRALLRESAGTLDAGVWAGSYSSARWFGHFIHDELPLQLLTDSIGRTLLPARRQYPQEADWRAMLGVPEPERYGLLHVRELTVIDDHAQTPDKRRRYQLLRSRLAPVPSGHDRIYLRRGPGGEQRQLVNEDEVIARLSREGFHIVDPASLPVPELVRRCAGASVVVSIEGSHASPAAFLAAEGAAVLLLVPPHRVTICAARILMFHGLRAALFIGEPHARSLSTFKVDPEEMVRVLDQAISQPTSETGTAAA